MVDELFDLMVGAELTLDIFCLISSFGVGGSDIERLEISPKKDEN